MNDKRLGIIAKALCLAMVLVFIGIILYVGIRNIKRSTQQVMQNYGSASQEESGDTKDPLDDGQAVEFLVDEAVDGTVSISDVGRDAEDSAINEVEEESRYINTTDLLPSVYKERVWVSKDKVDTTDFPDSYMLNNLKSVEVGSVIMKLPKEVYLYNTGIPKSSSLQVKVSFEGDESRIRSVGWASSDSTKVSVSAGAGRQVVLTAEDPTFTGMVPVKVLVSYVNDDTSSETKEVTLDVFVEEITYGDVALRDKNGNQLFLDKEGTLLAHVSDYPAFDTFYGPVATTGWQVISGKKYYFNADSWAVTGRQIIGGLPYEFNKDGVLISNDMEMGIDVSKWQKEIDWEQVAKSGVDFVIIRCGYRGSLSGTLAEDEYFKRNIEGATKNGIKVGVYFFTQAITEEEAKEEALMAVKMCQGYPIELPIYIDSENAVRGRANSLGRRERTNCLAAFCKTVEKSGYVGGVYASKSWFYNKVYADELEKYNIWVAQYAQECNYTGKTDFWQYSSKEHVEGITGYVDMNVVRINP